MFEPRDDHPAASDLELVEELELNTREEIEEAREHDALQLRVPTTLTPGNASDRSVPELAGTSREVSPRRVIARFDAPVAVGDVYRVGFDREQLDVAPAHALCRRCSLDDDGRFEAVLTFFAPIRIT